MISYKVTPSKNKNHFDKNWKTCMQLYAIHTLDLDDEVFRFPSANVYSLPREELVGTEI